MRIRTKMRNRKDEFKMKEDLQFLKDFQEELNNQDVDCQAHPRFWVIMDYKWDVTAEGHHCRVTLFNSDACEPVDIEQYIDGVLNTDKRDDFNEDEIEELEIWSDDISLFESDILNWIEEHEEFYYWIYETQNSFIVPETLFFSKEEAKNHLKQNSHHYTSKAHTYAMTAWRAPKMEKLMNILMEFDWDSCDA